MEEFTTKAFFYRLTKAIWYIFSFFEFFLGLRFFFVLLAANPQAVFTQFVYSLTEPLLSPFSNVFNLMPAGRGYIDPNIILALFIYYIIAWGIIQIIMMARPVEHHAKYNGNFKNKTP